MTVSDTSAREFLNHLFTGLGGYCELTFIAPKGIELFPAIFTESYKIGADKIDFESVAEFNRRGYGCYFGVTSKRNPPATGKRACEDDALWLTALWGEMDLKSDAYNSTQDMHDTLYKLPQIPTTIVFSGGGLHAYWKIAPVLITRNNRDIIKRTLQGLSKKIKGDSVWDLARVMRLPGTRNTKPDRGNALCMITNHTNDHAYRLEDFAHYAELAAPKRKPVKRSETPPGKIPSYVQWFLRHPHADGTRNNALNWTAHLMMTEGFSLLDAEQWLLNRAVALGLGERESLATIRSPYRKG